MPSLHSCGLFLRWHRLQCRQQPLCGWGWLWWSRWWPLLLQCWEQWLQFHQWPQPQWHQLQYGYHLQDINHQEELQELKHHPPHPPQACSFPALRPDALPTPLCTLSKAGGTGAASGWGMFRSLSIPLSLASSPQTALTHSQC